MGGMFDAQTRSMRYFVFVETTCTLWKSFGLGEIFSRLATIDFNDCPRSELYSRIGIEFIELLLLLK